MIYIISFFRPQLFLCRIKRYMRLLIVYGTTEGQTRKIAEFLALEAENAGADVTLCDASMEPVRPDDYDAVMIGASLHMYKYQNSVGHYIKNHVSTLNDMPSLFFSVSMSALYAGHDEETFQELKDITEAFHVGTGWDPTVIEYVAGALRYTQYDFFKKMVMRLIARSNHGDTDTSHDYEYTDWAKL